MAGLERFRAAQDRPHDGYAAALHEIEGGRKRGHWIWYLFPQLAGLGSSPAAQEFGIQGAREAADYLRDVILRDRLLTMSRAVAAQLAGGRSLPALMGSHIDALKVVSSMTLFRDTAAGLHAREGDAVYRELEAVAGDVLAAAAAQGYPPCAYTLNHLPTGDRDLPDA